MGAAFPLRVVSQRPPFEPDATSSYHGSSRNLPMGWLRQPESGNWGSRCPIASIAEWARQGCMGRVIPSALIATARWGVDEPADVGQTSAVPECAARFYQPQLLFVFDPFTGTRSMGHVFDAVKHALISASRGTSDTLGAEQMISAIVSCARR